MSQEWKPEARILPSRITIELSELSAKQRKSILGLIKDMGFVPEEIREIAVLVQVSAGDAAERGDPMEAGVEGTTRENGK